MVKLTLPELLTLTLYILTVSLLLIALAARHEKAQRLSAAISLLFGALASCSLYACFTGQSDGWLIEAPSSASKTPPAKKGAALGGGGGDEGAAAANGVHRGAAASGGGSAGEEGSASESAPEKASVTNPPLGIARASFAPGRHQSATNMPFRDCRGCPEMIVVPSGFAPYGSDATDANADANERPQRIVRIAKPFALGRFEVTDREFSAFRFATGRSAPICALSEASGSLAPVQCVTWREAREYVNWLSELTGKSYRLPTSSEWEYAARARTGTAYPFGAEFISAAANIGFGAKSVRDVGSFPANGFGFSDMTGNVAELVADCWLPTLQAAPTDGASAYRGADCSLRTLRDAAWFEGATLARSAARRPIAPDTSAAGIGFRVARDLR